MKKTIITTGLAAVSFAALIGGVALAQQAPTGPAARQAQPVTQAAFVQTRVSRLTALDTNHDGTVSTEEMRAAAQARRAERISQRFERLDADKNGQLSRAEFDAPRARNGDRPADQTAHRGSRGGQHHGRLMGRRGGHEVGQRIGRHGPVVIADVQTKLTENFARRDANHDGVLSPEERRAGRVAMRDNRRQHRAERMAHRAGHPHTATSTSPSAPGSE